MKGFEQVDTPARFYIAIGHDLLSNPEPREAVVTGRLYSSAGRGDCVRVDIDPPIYTRFQGKEDVVACTVFLQLHRKGTADIGTSTVFADVVVCPTYVDGPLDPSLCSKVGAACLYGTLEEAQRASPPSNG